MGAARCTEDEFIRIWRDGGARKVSVDFNLPLPMVYKRRRGIERRRGIILDSPTDAKLVIPANRRRLNFTIESGTALVGSDVHCWPGPMTTGQRAFIHAAKSLKPGAIFLNGDVFDGSRISRHPVTGWDVLPNVKQELQAVADFETALRLAHNAKFRFWTRGNHDMRFEQRIAANVPEMEGVSGTTLQDRFPEWQHCVSVMVNEGTEHPVMIKHRYHNGIHALHNNVLKAGMSMVTGHLHALGERRWTNYRGTAYAVDSGTLASADGDQFKQYVEDNPVNWRSGFPVLTWHESRMLQPEFVEVMDEDEGLVTFRGKVYEV